MIVTVAFNTITTFKPEITHVTDAIIYDLGHDSISTLAETIKVYFSL